MPRAGADSPMTYSPRTSLVFSAALLSLWCAPLLAAPTLAVRASEALRLFEEAEAAFQPPDPQWFEDTRQALAEEVERVDSALESQGADYARAWKDHLRWPLLTGNLGDADAMNVDELALVRRWLYSNREGLEYDFFAQLRTRVEAHLDAAVAFTDDNLEATFRQKVALLQEQLRALAIENTDTNAAAVGRTLGWLEQVRQLEEEVVTTRELISLPNAQICVDKPLLERAIALLATNVQQTLPVSDRVNVPKASLLGRSRTVNVHGTASTSGEISLELLDNQDLGDLQLVYRGEIDSRCRSVVGPVTVAMRTLGPVTAITPVQFSMAGVNLITTRVQPEVRTRVTNVTAKNQLFERLGKRRVSAPDSRRQMNSRASYKAEKLLQEEMDDRVETVLDEIRAELQAARSSMGNFSDVFAPVAREGATPRWEGIQTTTDSVIVNGISQRREQLGSPVAAPTLADPADVQVQLHVSFFNNMLETIMAGKTFTDRYFMRYGRILQAELPPQLMVHSRSVRWSVDARKPRPLEISIPAPNRFRIELRFQKVVIGEEQFTGPTILTVEYDLLENEYGEYFLERDQDLALDSSLPAEQEAFLHGKMSAFFAPILDAGGVALPEGGSLGRLRGLQPAGARAADNWLTLGVNIPDEVLKEWLPIAAE